MCKAVYYRSYYNTKNLRKSNNSKLFKQYKAWQNTHAPMESAVANQYTDKEWCIWFFRLSYAGDRAKIIIFSWKKSGKQSSQNVSNNYFWFSQFNCSVMSDCWQPHGLQYTSLPCPSATPGACSNSYPSSLCCHPTSHPLSSPSPPAFNLSQHQVFFPWFSSSHQVAKVLELQLQHQSFLWIFRTYFLNDWLVWSPYSPRDSQESSPMSQFKSINIFLIILFFLNYFIVKYTCVYI